MCSSVGLLRLPFDQLFKNEIFQCFKIIYIAYNIHNTSTKYIAFCNNVRSTYCVQAGLQITLMYFDFTELSLATHLKVQHWSSKSDICMTGRLHCNFIDLYLVFVLTGSSDVILSEEHYNFLTSPLISVSFARALLVIHKWFLAWLVAFNSL